MLRHRFFLMDENAATGGAPGESKPGAGGEGTGAPADNKGAGTGAPPADGDAGGLDVSKFSPEAQNLIKSLRAENAQHRTKANNLETRLQGIEKGLKGLAGGEDDAETPEVKLQNLSVNLESAQMENALLSLAWQNGVGPESFKYFKFMMNEAVEALSEGQELTEDQILEVIAGVKAQNPGAQGKANSSVNGGGAGKPPADSGEITAEQWKKMGISAKSKLYQEKPELYAQLKAKHGL